MARILFSVKQQHSTVLISIKQSLSEALRGWPPLPLFSFLTYLKWPTQQQLCILFKPSLVYRQPPIRENNGSVCVAGSGNHTETFVENLRSMSSTVHDWVQEWIQSCVQQKCNLQRRIQWHPLNLWVFRLVWFGYDSHTPPGSYIWTFSPQ